MDEKRILIELIKISQSISQIQFNNSQLSNWLPKKTVMRFFDYGETQMRELEKENSLITSKIKSRKFYSVASILNLIENNKIGK